MEQIWTKKAYFLDPTPREIPRVNSKHSTETFNFSYFIYKAKKKKKNNGMIFDLDKVYFLDPA